MVMAIQHFNTIWCRNPGHIVRDMVTHWVPPRRSEKQAKNNEESISERLVQASKREKRKNKNKPATKRRKRNRPTRKKTNKRTRRKERTKEKTARRKKKRKKQEQSSNRKRRRKKGTVSKLLVQKTLSLSINIWVRKKGFKLIIMGKALVLITRAFLEG